MTAKRSWLGLAAAVVLAVLLCGVQADRDPLPDIGTDTVPGGPYPNDHDDGVFANREEILPDQRAGYYREYTVATPGSDDRGARRIVAGDGASSTGPTTTTPRSRGSRGDPMTTPSEGRAALRSLNSHGDPG